MWCCLCFSWCYSNCISIPSIYRTRVWVIHVTFVRLPFLPLFFPRLYLFEMAMTFVSARIHPSVRWTEYIYSFQRRKKWMRNARIKEAVEILRSRLAHLFYVFLLLGNSINTEKSGKSSTHIWSNVKWSACASFDFLFLLFLPFFFQIQFVWLIFLFIWTTSQRAKEEERSYA